MRWSIATSISRSLMGNSARSVTAQTRSRATSQGGGGGRRGTGNSCPPRTKSTLSCENDLTWEGELLHTFHELAPIASSTGMRLSFKEDKSALVTLAYNPSLNSAARPPRQLGAVHGGMYAVLADTAGWFASARSRGAGAWPLTTSLNLHFIKAVEAKGIVARGILRHSSARQVFLRKITIQNTSNMTSNVVQSNQDVCDVEITDDSGALVAHATAVFSVPCTPREKRHHTPSHATSSGHSALPS